MLKTICVASVLLGACILLYSICKYYHQLNYLREEVYGKKTFSRWTYLVCMLLMVFFLLGYLALGIFYILEPTISADNILISSVFFFGSIFVMLVVTVQGQMSSTISCQADEMVVTLINAMEAKDGYTRGHSEHVSNIVLLFYGYLPLALRRQINLTQLMDAAILHDIGKIGISDTVLNKPGSLTQEEMEIIKMHPRLGKQILERTSFNKLGYIIMTHHERVDGKGYYKVPGDEIPVEARIIAIADTFSALYSDRVYRPRLSYADAIQVLVDDAGHHLDAELVDVFISIPKEEIDRTSKNLFV